MKFFSPEALDFRDQAKQLMVTRNLVIAGLFTALYVVLSYFNIRISALIEIRFPFLVLAAAGMYGGPVMAVVVAVASDILSTILTGGAFFPGFTLSYSLMAFLFGLIFFRGRLSAPRAVAAALTEAVISLTLHTLWLSLMYGTPYAALFVTRAPKCGIMFVVNTAVLTVVLGAFRQVMHTLHLSLVN